MLSLPGESSPQAVSSYAPYAPGTVARRRVTIGYCGALLVIVFGTFMIHEAGHFLVGRLLGYQMVVTLNSAFPVGGYHSPLHATLANLGGPIVTMLQALVAVALIQRGWGMMVYGILFAAFSMRALAAGISVVHPNDEARISMALGWNQWIFPLLVIGILLFLVAYAHQRLKLHWSVNAWSWLVVSIGVALVVVIDNVFFV
jgi:hypothetical protein